MKQRLDRVPEYPHNGSLRMYNMFPFRRYNGQMGIDGMTTYLPDIAKMGYNAVWVNPLQAVGNLVHTHPNAVDTASGSLYAMADDVALNPTIFPVPNHINDPNEQQAYRESQLKAWTSEARRLGMAPLFDLVLNHIGINEKDDAPLKQKLEFYGKANALCLLIPEKNERWPDIQGIDYYIKGTPEQKRGLMCEPKYLDPEKINLLFKVLWEPLITRYIKEYGFMGIRVDALTHTPVVIQQRAIMLVKTLVKEIYGTDAIIVGELMIGNPEHYLPALSALGLTHCLHPCSFYWGYNNEGGYQNLNSPFTSQVTGLSPIVMTPDRHISSLNNLVILEGELSVSSKFKNNSIYIFTQQQKRYCALNVDDTDLWFGNAVIVPIDDLEDKELVKLIKSYDALSKELKDNGTNFGEFTVMYNRLGMETSNSSQEIEKVQLLFNNQKKSFLAAQNTLRLKQKNLEQTMLNHLHTSKELQRHFSAPRQVPGGLIGVVGNHDTGTLKAKTMLEIAYNRALSNANGNQAQITKIQQTYKEFKTATIKGIINTTDLMNRLQAEFKLSEMEKKQLYIDLNMRMREKMFIVSLMCTGGWYSLGGDEFGVCHKPEVFQEFAESYRVGSSMVERRDSNDQQHDFRLFVRGLNKILELLPRPSVKDKTSLHYAVISNEQFGEKSADILFMVLRYSAEKDQYFLLGHCNKAISPSVLSDKLLSVLPSDILTCQVLITDKNGAIQAFDYNQGHLTKDGWYVNPSLSFDGSPLLKNSVFSQDNNNFSKPTESGCSLLTKSA